MSMCSDKYGISKKFLNIFAPKHIASTRYTTSPMLWIKNKKIGLLSYLKLGYKGYTIRITNPCNKYPLKPDFYIVKLGYTGV